MVLKRLISFLTASAIGFSGILTVSAAERTDTAYADVSNTDSVGLLQTEAPFGGHNYRLNYENSFPSDSSLDCATVKLSEPSGTLTFMDNMSDDERKAKNSQYFCYAGSVKTEDEVYDVYRDKYVPAFSAPEDMSNNFILVRAVNRKKDGDGTEPRTVSVPMYVLADALKHFGFREGTVDEISGGEWGDVKAEITEDETSLLETNEPYTVYADLMMRKTSDSIYLDGYDMQSDTIPYLDEGPQMTAYTEGRFKVELDIPRDRYRINDPCMMYSAEKRFERSSSALKLSESEDIIIVHREEEKLKGKYAIECSITMTGKAFERSGALKVVEKLSGMETEEYFRSSEYNTSYMDGYKYRSSQFIKTYWADGRQYDLYKVLYKNGWAACHEEYVAIRNYQPEKDMNIEGRVSLYEHMSVILDDYDPSDYIVLSAMTDVRMVQNTTGYCEVLKNDMNVVDMNSSRCSLDYEYTYTDDRTWCYAKVTMKDPDAELRFYECPKEQLKSTRSSSYGAYVGSIDVDGRSYSVYRYNSGGFGYTTNYENFSNNLRFVCDADPNSDDDPSAVRKVSVPVYALTEAAKAFGFRKGTITDYSVGPGSGMAGEMEVLKKELTVDEKSASDEEGACNVYADFRFKNSSCLIIDGYDFEGEIYANSVIWDTKAKKNGCFSLNISDGTCAKDYPCILTAAGINRSRTSYYKLNCHNDVTADYSIDNKLEGKYALEYLFELYSPARSHYMYRYELKVVEKMSGMELEDYWDSFEGLGFLRGSNKFTLGQRRFLKTYTAGGHEYDLYEVEYKNYALDLYDYVAIRKDQPEDGTAFEGSVSMQEHLKNLDDYFCSDNQVTEAKLALRMVETTGSVNVLKNDINFIDHGTPEVITGDFNNDKKVDAMDVIAAKKLLVYRSDENVEADEYMDLNKNGKFDVGDIVLLQRYVLGSVRDFSKTE